MPVGFDGASYMPSSALQSTEGSLFGLAPILYLSLAPIEAEKSHDEVSVFDLSLVWVS